MWKALSAAAAFGGAIALSAVPAAAAQIFVCTGCTASPGGDPDTIDPASINVGFDGNHSAVSPLLIVVGVPNGGPAPTISLPTGVNPAAAGTHFGAATNGTTSGELDGTLTSGDAYMTVGLNPETNSESFVNWTRPTFPNGNTNPNAGVASFGLYVYGIDFALTGGMGGNSPINIDFTNIATGSYVIAYSCATAGTSCANGHVGDTPFTNAGFVATGNVPPVVPEPASLALLGTALAALGLIRGRKAGPADFTR
ncbi:MAG: PEP-CTERM sorting domain-containing protein [Stellaceae bacterium]